MLITEKEKELALCDKEIKQVIASKKSEISDKQFVGNDWSATFERIKQDNKNIGKLDYSKDRQIQRQVSLSAN